MAGCCLLQTVGLTTMIIMMMITIIIVIVIIDNKEGTYMLIDVAFSGDRNVIKKEQRRP